MNPEKPKPAELELSALVEELTFLQTELFGFIKFYDASTVDEDPANYYMEREWRCLTNVRFELKDLSRIIIPQAFVARLREEFPSYRGEVRPS